MSSSGAAETRDSRPSYTVAGFLSAMAIAIALIGIVWHPLRLILPAIILALVAVGMAPRGNRLAAAALFTCAGSLFAGLLVAVVTSHPLW